jgi:CubicO group peptidase (beta-lactamase class C family)
MPDRPSFLDAGGLGTLRDRLGRPDLLFLVRGFELEDPIMNRRLFVRGLGSALLAVPGGLSTEIAARGGEPEVGPDLGALLEAFRKEQGLPGLAAAAVRGDRIVVEGVAGVRRVGTDAKITLEDRFALASCTKPMTAAMVCRVIDRGKLSFDTTLADALPDVPMRADYRPVTVAQLLTHRGGIPPYTKMRLPDRWLGALEGLKGTPSEQRDQFVRRLLQEEPAARPGTQRVYSNAGYALAAFVASRRAGRTWETLMQEDVFRPLGMTRAGFGRPRSPSRPHEPAQHVREDQGYVPEPDPHQDQDGPAQTALAAAGGVHCSIRDFARFASYKLAAARGNDALLRPATARRWQELTQNGAGGDRSRRFFGGSPAVSTGCALWPSRNEAVVVAVNAGGADVAAIIEAVQQRGLKS